MARDPEGCLSCSLGETCGRHDDKVTVVECNGQTILTLLPADQIEDGDVLEEQCGDCGGLVRWNAERGRYECDGHEEVVSHGETYAGAEPCGAVYPLQTVDNIYRHRFS